MTKNEVNAKVAEAIEFLRRAQPGRPMSERTANREKANAIMAELTMRDLRKINDELLAMLGCYA